MAPRPHDAPKFGFEPRRMGPRGVAMKPPTMMIGQDRKRSFIPIILTSKMDNRKYAGVNDYARYVNHYYPRHGGWRDYGSEAGTRGPKSFATRHDENDGGEWIHPLNPHLPSFVRRVCRVPPPPPPRAEVLHTAPWMHSPSAAGLPPSCWCPVPRGLAPASARWVPSATVALPPTARWYHADPPLPPAIWRVPLWHRHLPPAQGSFVPPTLVAPVFGAPAPWLVPAPLWHGDVTAGTFVVPPTHPSLVTAHPQPSVVDCPSVDSQEPTLPIYSVPPPSYISYYINNPPPSYSSAPLNPITSTPYRSSSTSTSASPPPDYSTDSSDPDVPPYTSSPVNPTSSPSCSSPVATPQSPPSCPSPDATTTQSPSCSSPDNTTTKSPSYLNPDAEPYSPFNRNFNAKPYSPSLLNLSAKPYSPSLVNLRDDDSHSASLVDRTERTASQSFLNPDALPYPPTSQTEELVPPPLGPWLPEPGSPPPTMEPLVLDDTPFSEDPIFSTVWRPLPSTSFTVLSKRKFFTWSIGCGAEDTLIDY